VPGLKTTVEVRLEKANPEIKIILRVEELGNIGVE
jgi:hypothetical protein